MKVLVLYDSAYGNTEKLAEAIQTALASAHEVRLCQAQHFQNSDIVGIELLIVGSPTQGGRPTLPIQALLKNLPANSLKNLSVAVFDTRFAEKEHGLGLRLVMMTIGYAASRMAHALELKGGWLVAEPQGFIVKSKEGPLKDGELRHAQTWSKQLMQHV